MQLLVPRTGNSCSLGRQALFKRQAGLVIITFTLFSSPFFPFPLLSSFSVVDTILLSPETMPGAFHFLLFSCLLLAAASPSLAFGDGAIVAVLEDGTEMRERISLKGRPYRWMGSVEFSSRTADSVEDDFNHDGSDSMTSIEQRAAEEAESLVDLLGKSDEELAMLFSTVALFGSQEYREEIPENQVAFRAQQARDDLMRELHVRQGMAQPKTNASEPRAAAVTANSSLVQTNVTIEQEYEQQIAVANKSGQNRKLLGGGGGGGSSAEENDEEDIATYCKDNRYLLNNHNWPYTAQVALGYAPSYSSNAMSSHSCSATLISSSTALSAAHCFWDLEQGNLRSGHRIASPFLSVSILF